MTSEVTLSQCGQCERQRVESTGGAKLERQPRYRRLAIPTLRLDFDDPTAASVDCSQQLGMVAQSTRRLARGCFTQQLPSHAQLADEQVDELRRIDDAVAIRGREVIERDLQGRHTIRSPVE